MADEAILRIQATQNRGFQISLDDRFLSSNEYRSPPGRVPSSPLGFSEGEQCTKATQRVALERADFLMLPNAPHL